jgi:hypothetical protein
MKGVSRLLFIRLTEIIIMQTDQKSMRKTATSNLELQIAHTEPLIPNIDVQPTSVKNIVMAAIEGEIDIPEFQRSFVWKPPQVRDLAESLCNNFPIGTILCWHNAAYMEPRLTVKERQSEWIIDGQQRVTAFCFIVGRKPKWYPEKHWKEDFPRFETWVDVTSSIEELKFETRRNYQYASKKWVSLREICRKKEEDLSELAAGIKKTLPKKYEFVSKERIEAILHRVNQLFESMDRKSGYHVQKFVIDHDLESVATIFSRLNSGGTPVKETDTILAFIGAHHHGWVKREFLPFLEHLEDDGFNLDASLLVRTITGIGVGRTRIKEIPKEWWADTEKFSDAWKRTKHAVSHIVKLFMLNYGILSTDILPTRNALLPLFVLYDRFPDSCFKADKALHWFLLASRQGRFGGSSATTLDEDLKVIRAAGSFNKAYKSLLANLDNVNDEVTIEDCGERYTDRFLRLLYYLVIFKNGALDWMTGIRIGFDKSGSETNKGFEPEWHHVFPRAYMNREGKSIDKEEVNSFANIAVLAQKANRSFRANAPKEYISEYKVTNEMLKQQIVPINRLYRSAPHFRSFLKVRGKWLSDSLTDYFQGLRS